MPKVPQLTIQRVTIKIDLIQNNLEPTAGYQRSLRTRVRIGGIVQGREILKFAALSQLGCLLRGARDSKPFDLVALHRPLPDTLHRFGIESRQRDRDLRNRVEFR